MNARPDTNPTDQAEAEKPVMERPIGRRTMLRAMILTVPVVAAFSRNAWAASIGCVPGCEKCAHPTCLPSGCILKGKSCNNGQCAQYECAVIGARLQNDNQAGVLQSPFGSGQAAITDGGFNNSPWQ